ncbi:uncharacterized protein LOC113239276 [Hyposmocoma kahamanoa]|uniref:uncharacterized protein LOC113239276 n=1 Tax=Hyposmocoma kahamanoa TaxID=1477025 RepID=UPI000E6D7B59|nr:uncharacterized protein LOC113239276 [Hyposmocoma kahamanoa]
MLRPSPDVVKLQVYEPEGSSAKVAFQPEGTSAMNTTAGMLRGRPYGGVILLWRGHVSWMQPKKWEIVVTPWVPEDGKRRRGSPRSYWRDDLDGFERAWWEIAKDERPMEDFGRDLRPSSPRYSTRVHREIMRMLMQTEVTDLSTKISSIRADLDEAIHSVQFLSERHDDQVKLNKETEGTIRQLIKDNTLLSAQVADISIKLGHMEQQYRECNIEIQSVPEFKNENLLNLIQQLLKTVSCNVPDNEILSFHRVAKQNSKSDRPRNIIVKFSSTRTRDSVLAATKVFNEHNKQDKLNTSHLGIASSKKPVYVMEHLSPANKLLHAATRSVAKEKHYEFVWVKNGRVFIRKDQKDSAKLVKNMDFLKSL